jgi:predicted metal-dependent hydrolase
MLIFSVGLQCVVFVKYCLDLLIGGELISICFLDTFSYITNLPGVSREVVGLVRRQQAKFVEQPRQSAREMVNGESHYFLGRRYRLRVHEQPGKQYVAIRGIASMDLFINLGRTTEQREAVLLRWYRQQLNKLIPPLVAQWEKTLNVQANDWGIKRMKTKWGSCNPISKRLWFNLELAKKPVQCLEYIVAHELAHLLERNHTERFKGLLDRHLPNWQQSRAVLSEMPLGHERW